MDKRMTRSKKRTRKVRPSDAALKFVELHHPHSSDGEKWRFAQIKTLIDLFERIHGRPARTIAEMDDWLAGLDHSDDKYWSDDDEGPANDA